MTAGIVKHSSRGSAQRMIPRVAAALMLICQFGLCTPFDAATEPDSAPPSASVPFLVGVGTHSATPAGLQMIQDAGIDSVRDDLHWSAVETVKGTFAMPARYDQYVDSLIQHGLKPLLILNYGNKFYDNGLYPTSEEAVHGFAAFASFVVKHFQGRVNLFEIWNEWNGTAGMPPGTPPGDPAAYVRLLSTTYARIKHDSPGVTVIGGVLAGTGEQHGWLKAALDAGMLDHLDAFSLHPYSIERPGKEFPERGMFAQIKRLRSMMEPYLAGRPLDWYVTEIGWPNFTAPEGSTPETSAKLLARSILLARTFPFVKGIWWYDWSDDGTNPADRENNFGLLRHDFTPKPAYFVMKEMQQSLHGYTYKSDRQSDATHYIVRLQSPGELAVAIWETVDDQANAAVTVHSTTAPPAATLQILQQGRSQVAWTNSGPGLWTIKVRPATMPLLLHMQAADCDIAW